MRTNYYNLQIFKYVFKSKPKIGWNQCGATQDGVQIEAGLQAILNDFNGSNGV